MRDSRGKRREPVGASGGGDVSACTRSERITAARREEALQPSARVEGRAGTEPGPGQRRQETRRARTRTPEGRPARPLLLAAVFCSWDPTHAARHAAAQRRTPSEAMRCEARAWGAAERAGIVTGRGGGTQRPEGLDSTGQHWTRLQASAQHAKNLFSEEAHR